MKIDRVKFVRISDLFDTYNSLLNSFCEQCDDFSWGDANMTLISNKRFKNAFESIEPDEDDTENYNEMLETIDNLPDDVYIDMEN